MLKKNIDNIYFHSPFGIVAQCTGIANNREDHRWRHLVFTNDERVRLIGIDAPESRPNPRAKKQARAEGKDEKTILQIGKESAKFVKTIVKPVDEVKIEFDVERRDRYGRSLAYVYLSQVPASWSRRSDLNRGPSDYEARKRENKTRCNFNEFA